MLIKVFIDANIYKFFNMQIFNFYLGRETDALRSEGA